MKISYLEIIKYKSFSEPFILRNPGKLHILIGPNNSGKTNILDAISQLYQINPGRLRFTKTILNVKFTLFNKTESELVVRQKNEKKKFYLNKKVISSARAKFFLKKHILRISALHEFDILQLQNEYQIFKKKYPSRFNRFQQSLIDHFPKIQITNDFFKHSVVHEDEQVRSFERLGDGFKQIFIILLFLYHPQYSIILLEEPEIHLHPGLAKKLFKVIDEEKIDNQIFLTTHSPLFIRPTNLHRVFRVSKAKGSTHVDSPRLVGKRLNYNRLKQELNADNLEMFFSDKVLLVEGPSDHILMRGLIDRFYKGRNDIKVIQTYGKSNVDIYADLLDVFNVPYVVLLDRDALYDTGIKIIQSRIKSNFSLPERTLISMLKKNKVFILPNGSIERNYPRKFQRRRKHKPQNALYASTRITQAEFKSSTMKNLKEVIDNL